MAKKTEGPRDRFMCCGKVAKIETEFFDDDSHCYVYSCGVCKKKWSKHLYDMTGEKVEYSQPELKKKEPDQCGNCSFGQEAPFTKHEKKVFACRRFPPHQTGTQQTPGPYPFPMVLSTEWCGEHKPKTKSKEK